MTTQLSLFPLSDGAQVQVSVSRYPGGIFRATIAEGRWSAAGKTAEEAARRCVDAYEFEQNAANFGLGAWQ